MFKFLFTKSLKVIYDKERKKERLIRSV